MFLVGAVLIVVMTALNLRDWFAGVVVLGAWSFLWFAWIAKDTRTATPTLEERALRQKQTQTGTLIGTVLVIAFLFFRGQTAVPSPTPSPTFSPSSTVAVVSTFAATPLPSPTPDFCRRGVPTDALGQIAFDVTCVPSNAPAASSLLIPVLGWTRGPVDSSIIHTAVADYRAASPPSVVRSLELEVQNLPDADRARANADLTERGYASLSAVTLPGGPAQIGSESNLSRVVLSFARGSVVFQITVRVASGVQPTAATRTAMSDYAVRFASDYIAARR